MATAPTLPFGSDGTTGLTKLWVHIILGMTIAAALTACPDDKSSEETGPASGGTSGEPAAAGETAADASPLAEPTRPEAMPLLCTFDAGKWCGAACPKGNAGPLCCTDETCVPWDAAGLVCEGVVGWCNNYTKIEDPKAAQIGLWGAVCHDAI